MDMGTSSEASQANPVARDLMRAPVIRVHPSMSLVDFERMLLEQRVGGAPVYEHDKLVGVVSRSDIIRVLSLEQSLAEVQSQAFDHKAQVSERRAIELIGGHIGKRMQELKVRDAMTEVRGQVSPDASVREIATMMAEQRIHRVLVVDAGEVVGVIARLEIVRLVADGTLR